MKTKKQKQMNNPMSQDKNPIFNELLEAKVQTKLSVKSSNIVGFRVPGVSANYVNDFTKIDVKKDEFPRNGRNFVSVKKAFSKKTVNGKDTVVFTDMIFENKTTKKHERSRIIRSIPKELLERRLNTVDSFNSTIPDALVKISDDHSSYVNVEMLGALLRVVPKIVHKSKFAQGRYEELHEEGLDVSMKGRERRRQFSWFDIFIQAFTIHEKGRRLLKMYYEKMQCPENRWLDEEDTWVRHHGFTYKTSSVFVIIPRLIYFKKPEEDDETYRAFSNRQKGSLRSSGLDEDILDLIDHYTKIKTYKHVLADSVCDVDVYYNSSDGLVEESIIEQLSYCRFSGHLKSKVHYVMKKDDVTCTRYISRDIVKFWDTFYTTLEVSYLIDLYYTLDCMCSTVRQTYKKIDGMKIFDDETEYGKRYLDFEPASRIDSIKKLKNIVVRLMKAGRSHEAYSHMVALFCVVNHRIPKILINYNSEIRKWGSVHGGVLGFYPRYFTDHEGAGRRPLIELQFNPYISIFMQIFINEGKAICFFPNDLLDVKVISDIQHAVPDIKYKLDYEDIITPCLNNRNVFLRKDLPDVMVKQFQNIYTHGDKKLDQYFRHNVVTKRYSEIKPQKENAWKKSFVQKESELAPILEELTVIKRELHSRDLAHQKREAEFHKLLNNFRNRNGVKKQTVKQKRTYTDQEKKEFRNRTFNRQKPRGRRKGRSRNNRNIARKRKTEKEKRRQFDRDERKRKLSRSGPLSRKQMRSHNRAQNWIKKDGPKKREERIKRLKESKKWKKDYKPRIKKNPNTPMYAPKPYEDYITIEEKPLRNSHTKRFNESLKKNNSKIRILQDDLDSEDEDENSIHSFDEINTDEMDDEGIALSFKLPV